MSWPEEVQESKREAAMETRLKVEGMSCEGCVEAVTQALQKISGVQKVEVTLNPGAARVEHEAGVTPEQLIRAVQEAGYQASIQ